MAESPYPTNSNKAKAEEAAKASEERSIPVVIVTDKAVQKKKPLGRRIMETFTDDTSKNVGQYVVFDVIMPSVKAMISEAVSLGIDRLMFGESGHRGRSSSSSRSSGRGYTQYGAMSSGNRRDEREERTMSRRARANHEFDEIVLTDRGEAEMVIDRLDDLIRKYNFAKVSDLLSLVGITPSFQDEKWGWYSLVGYRIVRDRDGWRLVMPSTESAN